MSNLANILKNLEDDEKYYGEYGRQFLSKSDVKSLLYNPASFKDYKTDSKDLLLGRYFHTLLLEPHKIGQYLIVDASTRNTNKYKDAVSETGESVLLLKHEADQALFMVDCLMGNDEFVKDLRSDGVKYERPGVAEIMGHLWKGKLDIQGPYDYEYNIDVKTAEKMNRFKWDARDYNYDVQAYLYREIFGKPLVFWVVDKNTGLTGKFYTSEEFMAYGKAKVEEAITQYEKFFGFNATEEVEKFYLTETL